MLILCPTEHILMQKAKLEVKKQILASYFDAEKCKLVHKEPVIYKKTAIFLLTLTLSILVIIIV